MIITRISPFTNKKHTIDINISEEQYQKWCNGELIQNAMPNISADEREFIMTGITPDEWKKYIGND